MLVKMQVQHVISLDAKLSAQFDSLLQILQPIDTTALDNAVAQNVGVTKTLGDTMKTNSP